MGNCSRNIAKDHEQAARKKKAVFNNKKVIINQKQAVNTMRLTISNYHSDTVVPHSGAGLQTCAKALVKFVSNDNRHMAEAFSRCGVSRQRTPQLSPTATGIYTVIFERPGYQTLQVPNVEVQNGTLKTLNTTMTATA